MFLELFVVAFYMIFLLQSASRLPERIQSSFSAERAKGILEITQSINRAISEYLVVKVKASLLVGIPVALACWAFGITGAVTWGMITFFGNFLPYIGALAAIIPPVALAFLEFNTVWPPLLFVLDLALDSRHHRQPDRTGDDRQGSWPQPAGRADRPGVLEPALGVRGDGPGRSPDRHLQDRPRAHPGHAAPGQDDLGRY